MAGLSRMRCTTMVDETLPPPPDPAVAEERALRSEAETLNEVALGLVSELDLDALMQKVTDAGARLTGARYGFFFHDTVDDRGDAYLLFALAGVTRDAFAAANLPRAQELSTRKLVRDEIVRIDDVLGDPRYATNLPRFELPPGHPAVRSYLAVPLVDRHGEVLGGLLFGHPERGMFLERHERLALGLAAQAAIATDNARLYRGMRRELDARARVEAALRVSEQRYRELLQALPVAVYSTDAEGRLATFNDAAVGLWGRAPERGRDRFCGSVQLYTPSGAQLPAERSPVAVTLAEGRAQSRVEIVVARADGSRRSVLAHPQPIRDDDGRLIGALNVLVDITDHRLAESELAGTRDALALQVATLTRLRELGTRLAGPLPLHAALQEILATLVQLHGADFGLITLFDAATGTLQHGASIGFEADALRELCDIVPEHGLGACGAAFADRRRVVIDDVEHDATFDHWLSTAHAAGFRAVHSTPVITRSGDRLGVLSVHFAAPRRPSEREIQLADICARAAADTIASIRQQQTLQEADRRKDEFLAMLAHELRNPLAAMRYSLEILHMGDSDGETLARARGALDRQLVQMVRLIDDLLDVSRISSGKIELRRELVDLAQVLRNAIETCTAQLSAAGHELVVTLPDEPVLVDGDQARLVQVFGNLLANAAKYTPPKGHLGLTLVHAHGRAEVTVRDDGVGIPDAMLPGVFEMFTQVDGSKQRSQGGLGIGLGIAKRLVEMHGGSIAATSDGPGRGSAFIVRLPTSAGRHPFAHHDDHTDAPAVATRSLRVLVADDNEDAAEGLQVLLESLGHEVRLAHDGAAALELAEAWRPDAMVLDIGMPLLSGLDVCRKIRARPWGADVVLVALTGWGQADDLERSCEAGFDHHAVKPTDGATLAPLLDRATRPPSLRRRRFAQ